LKCKKREIGMKELKVYKDNLVTVWLPNAGIGHSLESYSRTFSYYAKGYANFVHPFWYKFKIQPYLRKDPDKRQYQKIIQTPKYWGLPPYHFIKLLKYKWVSEKIFNPEKEGQFLIVFDEGPHDFNNIQPYKFEFLNALLSISKIKENTRKLWPSIGIFHRSGDFKFFQPEEGASEKIRRTHGYGFIPPEYAADALRTLRKIAGWEVPAVLSTDAWPEEVECITSLGNVSLARNDSALTNMLEMRNHEILIFGTSSYGRWSYFLGNSFGVFPKTSDIVEDGDNPINIKDREGSWFIFEDETSLLNKENIEKVKLRLKKSK